MRNLVILPVGSRSLINQWPKSQRRFDVVSFGFDDSGIVPFDSNNHIIVKNYKYPAIKSIIESEDYSSYRNIWLPDDDLLISTEDLNKAFELFDYYRLNLGQISVHPDENLTYHYYLKQNKHKDIRRTNFVEIMCPMFSYDFLKTCLFSFNETKSGYGIEVYWSSLTDTRRTAIIDKVCVRHIREIRGGDLYSKLKKDAVDPHYEMYCIFKKFGINSIQDYLWVEGGVDF